MAASTENGNMKYLDELKSPTRFEDKDKQL